MSNQAVMRARNRTPGDVIPIIVPILLAFSQMILYFAIVGLEAASVYYDPGRGTIYAGFWCSIFFFVGWISMFYYICFKKSSCCGIYLVVQNILSAIFAITLIVFTAFFIDNPCLCFDILCRIPNWDYIWIWNDSYSYSRYGCTPRTKEKLPILKGLLSSAVLMLVSNLIFIVVYLISAVRSRVKPAPALRVAHPEEDSYEPIGRNQSTYLTPTISESHYYSPAVDCVRGSERPSAPIEMRSMKF